MKILKFEKFAKILIFILALLFLNMGQKSPLLSETILRSTEIKIVKLEPVINKEYIRELLITDVTKYMKKIAPLNKMSPELIVDKCLEYNLDITFVLAQGVTESHLGTKGKAAKTNSVFNVGAYDDGRVLHRYKHPNESIEPYILLLKEKYLVNGKEINDLLKHKGFKNIDGYRYASSVGYEKRLKELMTDISLETDIDKHWTLINLSETELLAYFGTNNSNELTAEK
jgi:hypothetical protein